MDLGQTITWILHQTCADENIPEKWIVSQRSCIDTYSHFEYMVRVHTYIISYSVLRFGLLLMLTYFKLWTDESARIFLMREYPWFVSTWDNYAFPIQRADAIRYFVLYHYGGLYLDMDTVCHKPLPLDNLIIGSWAATAIFKSTLPTGVTNDMMVSSARHPAFANAIRLLPRYFHMTSFWSHLQPYCSIMLSAGPLFITLAALDFLLNHGPKDNAMIQVVNQTELAPFITDLESATWHSSDAKILMWIGERPWVWFALGIVPLATGLLLLNYTLRWFCRCWLLRGDLPGNLKLFKNA